jgi:hypothetical protein
MGATDPRKRNPDSMPDTHPDAPAGGGGPGRFRDANSFLNDDRLSETIRHTKTPSSRFWLAQANVGVASATGAMKAKKPPKTKVSTSTLVTLSTPEVDFDIEVRVLADRLNFGKIGAKVAQTRARPVGGVKQSKGMKLQAQDGKVVGLTRKLVIKGSYRIQTRYGRKAKSTDVSVYGRGTTAQDKTSGNVTLGFHEWCHQQEYLDFFTNNPFPVFTGKIGMSEEDFLEAAEQFNNDFDAYVAALKSLGPNVDEVGYKKSQCIADGKC